MQRIDQVPDAAELDIGFLARADVGIKAQAFCEWLRTRELRYTSICNYLSGIVSMMNYVYFELIVDADVLALSPTPLEQVVNLRDQAHGAIKQENLFEPNNIKGGFIEWADVQRTRLNAMKALGEMPTNATATQRKVALQQAALLSLMSLIPPDRVGVIRKLRLSHSLVRRPGGGWRIDLTKRGSHKTSKHFGRASPRRRSNPSLPLQAPFFWIHRPSPLAESLSLCHAAFCAQLPSQLDSILDAYALALELDGPGGNEAYLFSPRMVTDRPLESSAYTQAVKRAFKKFSPGGREISPKTLRSSFM